MKYIVIALTLMSNTLLADGIKIDKIYNPYVNQLENELEYRLLAQKDSDKIEQRRHKIGYGRSLTDRFFAEIYAIGIDSNIQSFDLEAVEAEFKWQLTEQGEFPADWGLMFELEREFGESIWEYSTTLISVYEYQRWVATGNLTLTYEWGSDINNEWESQFSGQIRYRQKSLFEPAIELYVAQNTLAAGPVITGHTRLSAGKRIAWELGLILGLNDKSDDQSWKMNIEYEF